MTDNEFFRLDQESWYTEFVDTEVSEIQQDTCTHIEFFDLEDVPY